MFPQTQERAGEPSGRLSPEPASWQVRSGLPLAEAEQLLDYLDNLGCAEREVCILPEGVTVRWRTR